VPTSANQEDHVSMGPIAARHARTVLANVQQTLAIELVVAAQALDARLGVGDAWGGAAPEPGAGVAEALARVRTRIEPLAGDREPGPDLAAALELVRSGVLADLAGP
jgi:histidine ammonia-lyase